MRRQITGILLCLWGLAAVPLAAAADVTLHARATGIGPVRGTGAMPMTVRLSESWLRIDFDIPRGADGYLLADTAADQAWLISVDGDVALPVPAPTWTGFRLDPAAPCAAMGARCEPGAVDVVANTLVRRWRYRGADGRGPDGTDSGTLWVDPRTGLLLAFRGRVAGRDDVRGYDVLSVERGALDDALFALPRTIEQLETMTERRVSDRASRPD